MSIDNYNIYIIKNPLKMEKTCRKWTEEEERRLLQQVRAFPQNLSKCFLVVSEVIGRSPKAVELHWYNVLSKDPNCTCFLTASPKQILKNRKNSKGVKSNRNIWQRILSIIRNI